MNKKSQLWGNITIDAGMDIDQNVSTTCLNSGI